MFGSSSHGHSSHREVGERLKGVSVFRRGLLVLLVCLIGVGIPAVFGGAETVYVAATEGLIRRAFVEMEISYDQSTDSGGDPVWGFTHRGIMATIIPHDPLGAGSYASLLFYAGWTADGPFPLSAINEWNRVARFGRAYVDDQGDPVIELDLLLAGGVTFQTIKAYIEVFVDSALSLGAVVQP